MPVLVSAYFRARRADGTHPRSAAACAISPDPRRFAGHRRGRDGRRARPHRPSCRKTTTIRGRNELLACRSASRFYSADGRSTVGDATRVTRVTLSRVDHQRQRLARPAEPRNDRHDDIPRPRILRASTVERRPGPRRFGPRVDGRAGGTWVLRFVRFEYNYGGTSVLAVRVRPTAHADLRRR